MLFDSGATQSFVSLVLNKKFYDAPGFMDYPLEINSVVDQFVSASRIHLGCVLNFFSKR